MPKGIYPRTEKNFIGKANPNYKGGNSICFDCKKELKYRYSWKKEPRCRSCFLKYSVGKNASNWKGGKEYPNCINCKARTGDWNSVLCHKCYRGALHPFWNGGISQLQSLVRASKENRQWIKQCMYRDNFSCRECGIESNGNNLQVHHIKQFAQILKDEKIKTLEQARECSKLWDNDNGITLCKSCHKMTESFNRKIN